MTIVEWSVNFSEKLNELLEERQMTQQELARDSGVSVGSVSSYIKGTSLPGIKAILNMAFVLDVDANELIDFGDTID